MVQNEVISQLTMCFQHHTVCAHNEYQKVQVIETPQQSVTENLITVHA